NSPFASSTRRLGIMVTGPFWRNEPNAPGVADRPFWRNEPNSQVIPDFGETNPMPKNRLGSFWRNEPNPLNPVVPAKARTHDHRPVFMGPGSRCARPGRRWAGRFWRNEPNSRMQAVGLPFATPCFFTPPAGRGNAAN